MRPSSKIASRRPRAGLPALVLAGLVSACGDESNAADAAAGGPGSGASQPGANMPSGSGAAGTSSGSQATPAGQMAPGNPTNEAAPAPSGGVQVPGNAAGGTAGMSGSQTAPGGAPEMAAGTPGGVDVAPEDAAQMTFFVTSETNPTGNLGGIAGADAKCLRLAEAAGAADHTWRAYLSAEDDGSGQPVHAGQRIGSGPWVNRSGVTVAESVDALHALAGSADLFIDENGTRINGQWPGSPTPVQHDVLTGSNADGTVLAGSTCEGWTSESAALAARVGHSDGLGPMQDATPPRNSWNSAHDNGGCNDTAPRGGSGRFYCFAAD